METTVRRGKKKKRSAQMPWGSGAGTVSASSLEPVSFPRPRKWRGSQSLFPVPQRDPYDTRLLKVATGDEGHKEMKNCLQDFLLCPEPLSYRGPAACAAGSPCWPP